MDVTAFHKLRTAVQANAHPADAQHHQALATALQAAFERSGLFSEVELGTTDDPDRLVIGVCRCAADVLPWEAGIGVERLWKAAVVDRQWQAHTVGCTESLMEFEAAVTVDESGHYVTVNIVAEPPLGWTPDRSDASDTMGSEPATA
jgi:hypothetical protein